jgi:hypothetical protein
MTAQVLTAQEAEALVTRIGPSLGYDMTYAAQFPQGRSDVCVVRRLAENGSSFGYDTIYLVWKDKDGMVRHREIINSRASKDYINIDAVQVEGDAIAVEYGSGGSYSGSPWKDRKVVRLE